MSTAPRNPLRARAARVRTFKDPASAWTHFVGFLAALVATPILVASVGFDGPKAAGMAAYGASLVGLFLASSVYHFYDLGERGNRWLRRLDHAAIFLLIAGTYVPVLIHLLDGSWRIAMLAGVVGVALVGAILKLAWIDSPSWLGMTLYFGLGWAVLIPGRLILPQLSALPLALLVAGGIAYTLGALVFMSRRPDPWPKHFGHHEIWHLFVLVGAGAHYAFTCTLIDDPYPPF